MTKKPKYDFTKLKVGQRNKVKTDNPVSCQHMAMTWAKKNGYGYHTERGDNCVYVVLWEQKK